MDRFEAMGILVAAVDAGSFSAASRALRIPLAKVSRRVSELEEHLGVRLLDRGTRRLEPTDAGRDYVAACRRLLEDIREAERAVSGEYVAPQGELVISAPETLGRLHLVPVVAEFLKVYADILARLQFTNRNVSLLEEHIDLALRVGQLPDSNMVATRVGLLRQVLCASPAYLEANGTPKAPGDLSSHQLVAYEGFWTGDYWAFGKTAVPHVARDSSRFVVNSAEAAIDAAAAGAGIARALSYQIDGLVQSQALVTLLDAYEPPPMPVALIYPRQRRVPQKLRAFLDFAVPRLRNRLGYDAGH